MTSPTSPSPPVEAAEASGDIVERLRAEGAGAMSQHLSLGMHKLCTEAADEIERLGDVILRGSDLHLDLASRITGLEAMLVDAQEDLKASEITAADSAVLISELRARIKALEAALRPFAEAYRRQGSPAAEYAGLESLAKHFARAAELVPKETT